MSKVNALAQDEREKMEEKIILMWRLIDSYRTGTMTDHVTNELKKLEAEYKRRFGSDGI